MAARKGRFLSPFPVKQMEREIAITGVKVKISKMILELKKPDF